MKLLVDVYGHELKLQEDTRSRQKAITQTTEKATIKPRLSAAMILLPVRFFWGLAFLAAGLDKLFNPKFLDSHATSYIGNQLAGFAKTSPLADFLTYVAVPNADIFGWTVLLGEIAIGLGLLVGFLSQTAAAFGFILNLILWLSAAWGGAAFFLIPELPFAVGFLALAIAKPHSVLSLDGQLRRWWNRRNTAGKQYANEADTHPDQLSDPTQPDPERKKLARRQVIQVAGATMLTGMVTGAAWGSTWIGKSSTPASSPKTATAGNSSGTAVGKGTVLTTLAKLPVGQSQTFVTPDTNQKAILIHDEDGTVMAYNATCTHMGCEVVFDKQDKDLFCPCHSARFECKGGQPTQGPAKEPLTRYKVQVDGSGNIVYFQNA
jgi:thiosulfate dehydrogenase [quinone] large subunit